jgi:RNA recognition motif-containing protein
MNLWVGNIAPGATEEDLRELVKKYAAAEVTSVKQVPGDGTRPAAIVDVAVSPDAANLIVQRLNGLYWKGRALTVQAMTSREAP